jgi:hypothetical protein
MLQFDGQGAWRAKLAAIHTPHGCTSNCLSHSGGAYYYCWNLVRKQSTRNVPDVASHHLVHFWCSVCARHANNNSMHHHCLVGNLTYSGAVCVRLLLMLPRRFVCQIPTCKKGRNLKTKDLRTHVHMYLYNCFWMHNSLLKFLRPISNHPV